MCGIVGLLQYKDKSLLTKMNEIQTHRGPDWKGEFWDDRNLVGLAMRRLSIVDVDSGHQPMTNEDGKIVLVFNGEIFNAPVLRKKLLKQGHIFKTKSSDTEVLVHLYEEYGVEMLNRLNGMFAFAIYDLKKKILFMARDQMGIKPLHYYYNGKQLAFASELKSLSKTGISRKKLDMQSVWQYMSLQCIPAPMTIYEDVKTLPGAHYLLFDIQKSSLTVKKYWDCIADRKVYTGTKSELREYVRDNIIEACERWTMSDVPLACSLSGGLDSSVIAAVISRKHELHTYSLGFTEQTDCDERALARELARKYGTNHEEILVDPDDLLEDIKEMIRALDAPYAGGLPSWFVFKRIKGHEKVAFNGTGGDELFGNYSKWLRYEHPLERIRSYQQYHQFGENVGEFFHYPIGSIYHKYMSEGMKRRILLDKGDENWNTNSYIEKKMKECPDKRWRDRIPYVDFKIQLPEEFLMMIDRFSMNFSIEARVPFLDRELVEKILGVPCSLRTRKYEAKYLLKEAMGDFLPESFLSAPKKGFVLPYCEWLYGRLKENVLDLCTGEYVQHQGIFSNRLEKDLIIPFYNGNKRLTPLVWTVFMFQWWYQEVG